MVEMRIELLRLIREYIKSSKTIDEDYIIRMIGIITKYRRLEEYVKVNDTIFTFDNDEIASYKIRERCVCVDLDYLLFEAKDYINPLNGELENLYGIHMAVLEILSHEIEHANQQRIIKLNRDAKQKILRATYSLIDESKLDKTDEEVDNMSASERALFDRQLQKMVKKVFTYRAFHFLAPEERLADVYAYKQINILLGMANNMEGGRLISLRTLYWYLSLYYLIGPYERISSFAGEDDSRVSPTIVYFSLMDYDDLATLHNLARKLNPKEAFELGLDLNPKVLKLLQDKRDRLSTKL